MLSRIQQTVSFSFTSLFSYSFSLLSPFFARVEYFTLGKSRDLLTQPDAFRKKIISDARNDENGVRVESLGIIGGNLAVVEPRSQEQFSYMLSVLDNEKNGHLTHESFRFFSGSSSFVIAEVGSEALMHRKQLSRYLVPVNYLTPTIQELEKVFSNKNEIKLRETVCGIVRSVTVKVVLGVHELPSNTYTIMKNYRSDIKKWGAFPMPGLFKYIPSLNKKRAVYAQFAKEILNGQFDEIENDLKNCAHPESRNLILTTMIDLIRKDNPGLDDEKFSILLKSLSREKIIKYYEHDTIKVLPMLLKAADNLTDALTLCLNHLSLDNEAKENIRAEIEKNGIFSNQTINYDALIHYSPYLDAWYKESIRFDTPVIVPRYTQSGLRYEGINIPANTIILFDLQAINKGEKYWDHPEDFSPARFMAAQNERAVNQFPFIPFSTGNRMCPASKITEVIFKTVIAYAVKNLDFQYLRKNEDETILSIKPSSNLNRGMIQQF